MSQFENWPLLTPASIPASVCDMLSEKHWGSSVPQIRKIDSGDAPSPYSEHILIEPVSGGYQASGVVISDRQTKHLSSVVHRAYDEALREAMAWSIDYGMPEIFVVGAADADRT